MTPNGGLQPVVVPLLPIALVGAATLLFEILLTRIFSVTMWYHFAFVAVSLALFGLAASGVAVAVAPHRFSAARTPRLLGAAAGAFGLAIPASFLVDLRIPFLPFEAGAVAYFYFLAKFLVLATPFFFSGLTLALAFSHASRQTHRIYFFDLVGGGVGCALTVPVLLVFSGPSAILLAAALPLLAAALFYGRAGARRAGVAAAVTALSFVALAAANEASPLLEITRVKSYDAALGQQAERPKLLERWHPVSRVAVHPAEVSRSPDRYYYSPTAPRRSPPILEVTNDGGALTFIYPQRPHDELAELFRADVTAQVFALTSSPDVLVIGVGGGKDVLAALHLGARRVTGVELNPTMLDIVQDDFAEWSGRPYDDPRVRLVIDEGRNFIASRDDRYDVILASATDTWAAAAGGAYALTENYLYTVEAFHDYLAHLAPNGFLSVTRWYPMESLRLITLAVESLRRAGVERPADRIALVRTPQTVTILIKNGDFTAEEIAHLADWARSGGLSMLHPLASDAGLAPADRAHRALARGEPIADEVPLNLEPPTDDRPFFFSLFTFRQASEGRFRVAWSFVLQHGRALALLLGLLRVTLVAVVLFVLAPLLIRRRDEAGSGPPLRTRLGSSLYFAALGFGFLLVEIPLIQQLILFLGHPVYSVTVVLFAMLVASGTGSLLAGRLAELGRLRPRLALLAAVVVLLGFNWLGPDLLRSLVGLALPLRIAIAVTAILPIGLLLGVPFPSGIRALHRTAPALVPWAWAINGAASVAAPAVAMLVAISSGFSTTLYLGAGAYVAAALLLPLIDRPAAAPVASLG